MVVAVYESDFNVSAQTLFEFYRNLQNLGRIHPPEMKVEVIEPDTPQEVGNVFRLRVNMPPINYRIRWDSELVDVEEGSYFVDQQIQGPFRNWRHEHRFIQKDDGTSRLIDRVTYEIIGGILGFLGERLVKTRLDWMFQFRHQMTKEILEGTKLQA